MIPHNCRPIDGGTQCPKILPTLNITCFFGSLGANFLKIQNIPIYPIDILPEVCDTIITVRGTPRGKAGEREMTDGMNNQQLNVLLEQIAKLIEATAKDAKEAAEIVRAAKVK